MESSATEVSSPIKGPFTSFTTLNGTLALARSSDESLKVAKALHVNLTAEHEHTINANGLKRKRSDELPVNSEEDAVTQGKNRRDKKRTKLGPPRTGMNKKATCAFLQGRAQDRINGIKPIINVSPRDIVAEAIRDHSADEDKRYVEALRKLPTNKLTTEKVAKIEKAKTFGANYLGRTASLAPGLRFGTWNRCTNGYTISTLLMPAADTWPNQCMHAKLTDMNEGHLTYMITQRLRWDDSRADEFLSYSVDPLFLMVHALDRHNQYQGKVTVQFLDRREARNIEDEPAAFYPVLELYETLNIPGRMGCTKPNQIALRARKFTQEYLSHSTIKVEDPRFVQADLEDLIKDGLYEIFPAFQVPTDHKRVGLYSGQVYLRTVGYPTIQPEDWGKSKGRMYSYTNCAKATALTLEFLNTVRKLTMNFMNRESGLVVSEPHLHVFLCFLTFEKRQKRDPVLLDWIRTHYKAEDVIDLYSDGNGGVQPGFTHVADNLPGVMQYIDLVDDANFAFGLPGLPPMVVHTQDTLTGEVYADADAKPHMKVPASHKYDEEANNERKDKAAEKRQQKRDKFKMLEKNAGTDGTAQPQSLISGSVNQNEGSNEDEASEEVEGDGDHDENK